MQNTAERAIAIVGVGAILPDAGNAREFWANIKQGRYSIGEVSKDRWDPEVYYNPDHRVPDKAYSKIGGWVKDFPWDPVKWRLPIPPRVVDAMDGTQKWAIACTREALEDYGYPGRTLDPDRTAVILGNAMAGEKHYLTSLRVYFPEFEKDLEASTEFAALPQPVRDAIKHDIQERMGKHLPEITEDSMPGELANCIAGRIANIFNFHGPNYVVDAACASAMAAINAAAEGLNEGNFDLAVTGGIDRNMGAPTFVKFCKIGALSATGTRPYGEGADGFVMGEGAVILLLKRLADAERDGDKIYAVLRGIGGSSDGKGKGITAPNPIGQKLAIQRAWDNAGLPLETAGYFEGHGTSTKVGDAVEVQSLTEVLNAAHVPVGTIALGSVKSNLGHLKGAAGAAGILKTAFALRDKVLPPSLHCEKPNPDIDFGHSPLYVNTSLKAWDVPKDGTRRAGVSAFGFGGTNFHAVLEEYVPGKLNGSGPKKFAAEEKPVNAAGGVLVSEKNVSGEVSLKAPLRGALVVGATTEAELVERLRKIQKKAEAGDAAAPAPPAEADLRAPQRLAIDYADATELAEKCGKALKALAANQPAVWKALRAQGIFRGQGPAGKVAFLYTGQGSQYVNMLQKLRAAEPIVAETFGEADKVMTPLLGKPLSEFIFVDHGNEAAVTEAEEHLRQTAITQPAVLAADLALTRLLAAYGIKPDMTMGHSLGEYGALVASEALPFADALEAVSARGREMTRVSVKDNGKMAAVFAPLEEIDRILKTVEGYAVIANINSERQAVIGGASAAVEQASAAFLKAGYNVVPLLVSHAFHTSIVAPASEPLRRTLERLRLQSPRVPIVANVNGEFYPSGPNVVPQMLDILAKQVASPVQFVKGLRTLHETGARVFVEVGPKKALHGFVEDLFGDCAGVSALFTNHPKTGDIAAFNQALCGLYAAGLGRGVAGVESEKEAEKIAPSVKKEETPMTTVKPFAAEASIAVMTPAVPTDRHMELGRLFAQTFEKGWEIWNGRKQAPASEPVVVTGAALGLPGTEHIFDDANIARILRGEQFIGAIPAELRQAMVEKHITRLVKSENGGPTFETISDVTDVIKLAGRGGKFDLENEFGVSAERIAALDKATRLAIAAGIDALRDAGIPLVMRYKTTSKGTLLPDRWGLPDALRDDTGVIFASAFPGYDSFADEMTRYYTDHARREQLLALEEVLAQVGESNGNAAARRVIEPRIAALRAAIEKEPYVLDRRLLFRILSMGHSQFAEFIGARGPNTQVNAACASTTQAVSLAEDWIREGRCRRAIIVSADDVTSDRLMEWIGAGFLASGAAATDELVEEAATPFDRRRHGMIVGMGAAALVVESAESARERGLQPICEILSAVTANSAFHGTRLDIQHIGQLMEELVAKAEAKSGISRREIAPRTVFMSHETYTPARGGSASAEIFALRQVFGDAADRIVIANTKGFTGHAMGTGIEDVVAVKALETGCVPPVANFKEVDPELGALNLSKGGEYPVEYALRLGAGFGSQISLTLLHWLGAKEGPRPRPDALGYSTRIADAATWKKWVDGISGRIGAELEVVRHTLRVVDKAATARTEEVAPAVAPVAATPAVPAAKAAVAAAAVAAAGVAAKPVVDKAPAVVAQPTAAEAASKPAATTSPKAEEKAADVKERILALVVEKTGYPKDMLDLDLDLEADLGVDTVKQAEMFAAIREIYSIPRDEKRKLRDYPTLAHVIRFVLEKRPELAGAESAALVSAAPAEVKNEESKPVVTSAATEAAEVPLSGTADDVKERILTLVVEKTGYPKDMLDLDLDLEADLGVDTVKQAEMFAAIREIYNIPRDENRKLRDYPTLAHVIGFVLEKRPDLAGVAPMPTPTAVETQPTASTEPVAAATPLAPVAETDETVQSKVLQIVAEKTGYPIDMLDLDLDLEADLGIDTVKQAEMFASVRAAFNIPRDENLKLRDFPTLARVIQFAKERMPSKAGALATVAAAQEKKEEEAKAAPAALKKARVARPAPMSLDAANAIPRRVPAPCLRPPLELCKPTGVAFCPGRFVVVMPDKHGVAEELIARLHSMNVETLRIETNWEPEELKAHLKNWMSQGPIEGVYWLPALDDEGALDKMDLTEWREALRVRAKSLYTTMRALYEQIASAGTFLVSGTRFGGQHGYDEAGATAPLGGAVAGFTKAYKRERMEATVKVVDFGREAKPADIAGLLIRETLRDPGAVEIGYKDGLRWSVGLRELPPRDCKPGMTLDGESVFLITGAAGGIVSAITADLATASGGTFYLLDLVPEPNPDDPDLKRFVTDKDGLKRELFARIQARGERATPALVEKELAALERALAASNAIAAVNATGGKAHYLCVNLTDAESVKQAVEKVRQQSGHIDVLLHAAGMERSHFLGDKEPGEFNLVFDVKSDGWFNLLKAIGDMPLGATVAFSSIAGRFGNGGQTDYSAANDLLCKLASSFRTTRPATRAIAIDWTAWGGIGMATRGSIPKMMEIAGIDMLAPEAGIPLIRRELTAGKTRGEVVIAQHLGILLNEWEAGGGLDTAAANAFLADRANTTGPMIGALKRMDLQHGLTMETTLNPAEQPFLYDHQIAETPVMPGVMGIEAFAETAAWLLPDWQIAAVEEVNFLAPFKFYRNEARPVTIEAAIYAEGEEIVADCKLTGSRMLPGKPEPQVTTHFTARVRLSKQTPQAQSSLPPGKPAETVINAEEIYRLYFHGPAYRVLERAWRDEERIVGQLAKNLPDNHFPAGKPLLMEPRLIELCFQTAGLWEMSVFGRMGLPNRIERVSLLRAPETSTELFAVVQPAANGETFEAEIIDTKGTQYLQLTGYRTVALPNRVEAESLKALQAVAL